MCITKEKEELDLNERFKLTIEDIKFSDWYKKAGENKMEINIHLSIIDTVNIETPEHNTVLIYELYLDEYEKSIPVIMKKVNIYKTNYIKEALIIEQLSTLKGKSI